MEISIFKNINHTKGTDRTTILDFLSQVKFGKWEEIAKKINAIEDKKERQEAKKKVPYVTISGAFDYRSASSLLAHSGFVCMDIDDIDDIDKTFEQLKNDPFTYGAFRSISGRGIAVIVKIDEKRHLDAWLGLESYYAKKYEVSVDRSCKDASRARFVSFDPETFTNEKSKIFKNYIPKSKQLTKKKLPNLIVGNNDIDFIISQVQTSSIDITQNDYEIYRNIGFALAAEFGEGGRSYFHAVAYYSTKYTQEGCDKQFNKCIKSGGQGIGLPTFLHYVKEAGVSIVSAETKHINTVSYMGRNAGRGVSEIVAQLKEIDDFDEELTKPLVEKVLASDEIGKDSKLSKLEALAIFINGYNPKRNEVTRIVDSYGKEIDTQFINTLWFKGATEVDDSIRVDEIDRYIGSDFVEDYNPLKEFFETNAHITLKGQIKALSECISSKNMYKEEFITKWLCGIIESVYGGHSPLALVLTGNQNAGKTEFFRRLIPSELKPYYAESHLDAGKDDEILMTQKLLIIDDEFGGKSKAESKRLKELTSKDYFDLREPYGRRNVRLKRLAVLGGSSNEPKLLNDPTGNRRVIPIQVDSMDFEGYNKIDKTALFMEVYHLWKSGYKWELDKDNIKTLNDQTAEFEQVSIEREMVLKFYRKPDYQRQNEVDNIIKLQQSEIKSEIEVFTKLKINIYRLSQELRKLGFSEDTFEIYGNNQRLYSVVRINDDQQREIRKGGNGEVEKVTNLPF